MSIISLSFGVACASIVFLLVKHEAHRDEFHEKGDRIYKVYRENAAGDESWERLSGGFHGEVGPMLADEIPEVQSVSRWRMYERPRVVYGEQEAERNAAYVDTTFLQMFSFPVVLGSDRVFRGPHEAAITQSMAGRMVGKEDISTLLDKQISILGKDGLATEVTVKAIVETPPSNSSLQFDILLPYELAPEVPASRVAYEMETAVFLLARTRADLPAIQRGLDAFRDTYYAKQMQAFRELGRWTKREAPISLKLLALKDVSKVGMEGDHVIYIYPHMLVLFTVAGMMVLVAGCGNFATLSIGRSMNKGKEIGIRKVSGARRWSLIRLSITESVLLSGLSVALGVILAELMLPSLLAMIPLPNFSISWALDIATLLFLFIFPLAVGCVAGLYPALVISRLDTVKALVGEAFPGGRNRVSHVLIVTQFAASLFLVVSTHILVKQFYFTQNADRGFDPAHVVTIRPTGSNAHVEATTARFIQMAQQDPNVVGLLATNEHVGRWASILKHPDVVGSIYHYRAVGDFAATIGVRMVAGRQPKDGDPLQQVIVNQTLVDHFEWDDPIGQTLPFPIGRIDRPVVVGVIEDFNFQEGRRPGGPLVIHRDPNLRIKTILARVRPESKEEAYGSVKSIWRKADPAGPHLFGELDWRGKPISGIYVMLTTVGSVVSVFGILISCFGLVGLAMQTLARRRKEVGVRKVLGASIPSIFRLLSSRFIRLTLYGSALGCLGSYFVVQKIVGGSAYQLPLTADLFLMPTVGVLLTAILSIGYHTLQTSRTNPAEELQCE